jgi:hypothetical protein
MIEVRIPYRAGKRAAKRGFHALRRVVIYFLPMRKPKPATGWRRPLELFNKGLMLALKPMQVVGNFVFLTLAYFVGVGITSLLYRLGPGKAESRKEAPRTYWRELPPAPRDKEAWLRPF